MSAKTIHIINNSSFYSKGMSGSDRRAIEWSKCWSEMGFIVKVFGHQEIKRRYVENNVRVRFKTVSKLKSGNNIKNIIYSTLKGIANSDEISKSDIIYSTSDIISDSLPGIVAKIKNKRARWICGLHLIAPNPMIGFTNPHIGRRYVPTMRSIFYFALQRFVLVLYKMMSDVVLVSNSRDRDFLLRMGFRKNGIIVKYGGVRMAAIPKGTEEKCYDACFVGRFHPQKGIYDMLDVWSMICRKMKNSKLIIVGEGQMMNDLVKRAEYLGIDGNIIFAGFVDGDEKYKIIKSSKMFLFPSTYESFGMSALEAMACGVPVVAYDLPVYREVFKGGMIRVPFGDKNVFFQEVLKLLKEKGFRESLGKEALTVASKFTWEETSRDIIDRIF